MVEDENKPKKNNGCLSGCGTILGIFFILGVIGSCIDENEGNSEIDKCNEGIEEVCEKLLKGSKDVSDKITNPIYRDTFLEKRRNIDNVKRRREEEGLRIDRCKRTLKNALKDPSSFKVLNGFSEQISTGIIRYSATNSFGGRVQEAFDCNEMRSIP